MSTFGKKMLTISCALAIAFIMGAYSSGLENDQANSTSVDTLQLAADHEDGSHG